MRMEPLVEGVSSKDTERIEGEAGTRISISLSNHLSCVPLLN